MDNNIVAYKIPVYESEKGWGRKIDDYMVCLSKKDALAFQKEFNSKNTTSEAPSWYMQCEGEVEPFSISTEQHKVLNKDKRVWLSMLNSISINEKIEEKISRVVQEGEKGKKKLYLFDIERDEVPCDSCDKTGEVAVIKTLAGNMAYICKSCLEDIIKEF